MSATSSMKASGGASEAFHELVERIGQGRLHLACQMRVDPRGARAAAAADREARPLSRRLLGGCKRPICEACCQQKFGGNDAQER